MALADEGVFQPADDVEEVLAYCARCDGTRTFVKGMGDFSDMEAQQLGSPNVQRALAGEPGWLCQQCGSFRRDPVAEKDYSIPFANVSALRSEDSEQGRHGRGVSEDLALRAEGVATPGMLHEPATDQDQVIPPVETTLEEGDVEDKALEQEVLEDVRRAERGEVELEYEHGPRKEMPPPERLPPRDPTAEDENL